MTRPTPAVRATQDRARRAGERFLDTAVQRATGSRGGAQTVRGAAPRTEGVAGTAVPGREASLRDTTGTRYFILGISSLGSDDRLA